MSKSEAASFFITPSDQKVNVGSVFNLTVKINTESKYINNAEGIISYSKDLIEFVSVSKNNSIFNLWVGEPVNSGTSGTISFNGGLKTPGFSGSDGTIFSLKFKAKKSGIANFSFSNHFIRENDGLGTNILTGQSGASVNIIAVAVEKTPVVEPTEINTEKTTLLSRLNIFSDTHPDQEKWYDLRNAHFTWKNPEGVLAISTLLDTRSNSVPSTKSTIVVSEKLKTNIKDGINYFHIIYKTIKGWSKPTHYSLKIDTVSPNIIKAENIVDSSGNNILNLEASDDLSGVDYFNVFIKDQNPVMVTAGNGFATYIIPQEYLVLGNNEVTVQVYDFAGNKKEITINVISNFIEKPTLEFVGNIRIGDSVKIKGKTKYPKLETFAFIISPNGKISKYIVSPNEQGEFIILGDKAFDKGKYTALVEIYDENGSLQVKSDRIDKNVTFSILRYIINSPLLSINIISFIVEIFILTLLINFLRYNNKKNKK
ncbi:MAG TPA: cohesin domain-containing protein [Candidatus Paceibacterota bacterium]|nr:cohesin domain-containing protein [Candidatus Paceibacterota bacterium]